MRVLVALSGGVDSSVAAAVLVEDGHEVVGATMKLWGGTTDSGCCSVADVVDARRVADELGIAHHVFDLSDAFEERVVGPYARDHAAGRTPNPCVECNRKIKFDRLLGRARRLGFDLLATGHHARVARPIGRGGRGGPPDATRLLRGRDRSKDQSYVLSVLSGDQLAKVALPVGEMTKAEVRALARSIGLRTAEKADSQDVCFVSSKGSEGDRAGFLAGRIELHEGRLVDSLGSVVGSVPAVELVTVGQRRGLGTCSAGPAGGTRRERLYALEVDVGSRTIVVGPESELAVEKVVLEERTWTNGRLPPGTEVTAQASAHGEARRAVLTSDGISFEVPARRIAPGQLVALYAGDQVVGSGVVANG